MLAISEIKKIVHSDLKINAILLASCLAFVFVCGVHLGLLRLELWSQVVDIWEVGASSQATPSDPAGLESESVLRGHLLRYSLVRPIFVLAAEIGVDYNSIYSYTLPLIVFVCTASLTLSAHHGSIRVVPAAAFVLTSFSFVFLIMDGRLPLAYTGISLVLLGFSLKLNWNSFFLKIVCVILGVYFCSVTSGTLIAIFIFSVMAILLEIFRYDRSILLVIYASVTIYSLYFFYGFYVMDGIVRSLGFYGFGLGSIIDAVAHGYGYTIGRVLPLWIAVPLIIGVAFLGILVLLKNAKRIAFNELIGLLLLGTTIFLGIWGISILALSLVPIAHLILTTIWRINSVNQSQQTII